MSYVQCPYCGKTDGNDDIILNKEIIYMDTSDCQISIKKQCDICGKEYEVIAEYKFSHEMLGEWFNAIFR